MSGKLFEKFGPAAAPSNLLALTPFELISLFTRSRDSADEVDRVSELHRINHEVRKGLQPSVPNWLMPKVTRGR